MAETELSYRAKMVKKALRIGHDEFDGEIEEMVGAAETDLEIAEVSRDLEIPIVEQAIILYCKWMYDFMGKGEEYRKAYERLRTSMSVGGVFAHENDERPKFFQ